MKSKKVKELLENQYNCRIDGENWVLTVDAIQAVELAEQEMLEKAVKARINTCHYHDDNEFCSIFQKECYKCELLEDFTNLLTN